MMTEIILVFAALVLLAGLVILVNPEIIFGYLRNNLESLTIHILAVIVRLGLGILLILQANQSKFPLIIEILGWLSIVAAISLAAMGRKNFLKLMNWAMNLLKPFGRIGGILAAAFGGFLIYAFV